MKFFYIILIFTLFSGVNKAFSQELITLEDAIQIGLEQNFGILLAKNEAEIDRLNRTLGNAGFLPNIELRGSGSEILESEAIRENNIHQGSTDYEVSAVSADVELGWTLFDGFGMFITYDKLGELQKLGQTLVKIEVENTIKDIITAYYDIVRQEKVLEVLQNSVEISQERYEIAQTKRELGSGTELELILAQSDLNSDRAEITRQEVVVSNAKATLIQLLDLESNQNFDVQSNIDMQSTLSIEDLIANFSKKNSELEAAKNRVDIAELELKEFRRERYPTIDANLGYTFNQEKTRNSILLHERTDGFFVGLTARLNIFDGFNTNRRVQTAQIRQKNETVRFREENKLLETELYAEYKNYESALELIELENENLELALNALDIALEQFRLATITSVELRETQNILSNTENRLIEAQFQAKISETKLLRLSGILNETLDFQ
jgi:outer membrane protein